MVEMGLSVKDIESMPYEELIRLLKTHNTLEMLEEEEKRTQESRAKRNNNI